MGNGMQVIDRIEVSVYDSGSPLEYAARLFGRFGDVWTWSSHPIEANRKNPIANSQERANRSLKA